jgi:hypothetical protein
VCERVYVWGGIYIYICVCHRSATNLYSHTHTFSLSTHTHTYENTHIHTHPQGQLFGWLRLPVHGECERQARRLGLGCERVSVRSGVGRLQWCMCVCECVCERERNGVFVCVSGFKHLQTHRQYNVRLRTKQTKSNIHTPAHTHHSAREEREQLCLLRSTLAHHTLTHTQAHTHTYTHTHLCERGERECCRVFCVQH